MDSVAELIETLRSAARSVRSVTDSTADELRALATARAAIDAAMSERLALLDEGGVPEVEDAPNVTAWARRELRQDSARTRQLIKAAVTMRELGSVGRSARAGRISFEHVNRFTFALAHVDNAAVRHLESVLLPVAEGHEPAQLKFVIDRLRAVVHPDELERAWLAGMDKADVSLHRVPDGWHLTGFLPAEVGARFKTVLNSLSTPREGDDLRTASERRVDSLDLLLTRVLAEGLPTDGTVRPQIHVVVDAGTLQQALTPGADSAFEPAEPATLVGFGAIGQNLLAHLTCGADLIPILVDRVDANSEVLDVGRRHREATPKQRHAVWFRQEGRCAVSHCRNAIDHVHHRRRWSDGGRTDLANLVGLCAACHRHEHRADAGAPLARAS